MRIFYSACSTALLSACAPSESDKLAREIGESVKVGEAAADQTPAYGFALYPGADVKASLMDGVSLQFETSASQEDIGAFYGKELERLGYSITSRETQEQKIVIEANSEIVVGEKIIVSIGTANGALNQFNLVLIKLAPSE